MILIPCGYMKGIHCPQSEKRNTSRIHSNMKYKKRGRYSPGKALYTEYEAPFEYRSHNVAQGYCGLTPHQVPLF